MLRQCRQHFDLYKWETSTIDAVAARTTDNYARVGSFTPTTGLSGMVVVNGTMDISFSTEESGVYLALVDQGTCVVIQRILVFYEGVVCPGRITDLIYHPDVLAPDNMVVGKCVANSSSSNGSDPVLRCTDEGVWEVVIPCLCSVGFESEAFEDVIFSCTGK